MRARIVTNEGGKLSQRLHSQPVGRFCCTILAYPPKSDKPLDPTKDLGIFNKPGYMCAYQLENNSVTPVPTRFGQMYHELEVCVLMNEKPLPCPVRDFPAEKGPIDLAIIKQSIAGIGLGIDWTLKDMIFGPGGLKEKGWPWDRAKTFDYSGAVTAFSDINNPGVGGDNAATLPDFEFSMIQNGEVTTKGNTKNLQFDILTQIWEMHKISRLRCGDVVMTGTPAIVPCNIGDKLTLKCEQLGIDYNVQVVSEDEYYKMIDAKNSKM